MDRPPGPKARIVGRGLVGDEPPIRPDRLVRAELSRNQGRSPYLVGGDGTHPAR